MSYPIPASEPRSITAGETALWQRCLASYPVGTWSLNYILVGPNTIQINGTANGAAHEIAVNAATTNAYNVGVYTVHARVSDGTNVFPVDTAYPTIEIKANPLYASTPAADADVRSWAVRTLEEVETALNSLSQKTVTSATINGTTFTLQNINELFSFRNKLKAEVQAEEEAARIAAGLPSKRLVYTQFSRPQ